MVGDISNHIGIPFFGFIYLISLLVAILQSITKMDLGVAGIICWIIVIVGAIGFIFYIIGNAVSS